MKRKKKRKNYRGENADIHFTLIASINGSFIILSVPSIPPSGLFSFSLLKYLFHYFYFTNSLLFNLFFSSKYAKISSIISSLSIKLLTL